MKPLRELQQNWEGLAQADPLWAICTAPEKRRHGWDRKEFFATGVKEVRAVLNCVASMGLRLDASSPALDFGCGVGRLTRPLAEKFSECWGVDISPTMIRLARKFNHDLSVGVTRTPQCHFLVNEQCRLETFPDNHFGFIYSSIVLQHMVDKLSAQYIAEFVRVLRPGGVLVFQLPDSYRGSAISRLRMKLALRSRTRRFFQRGAAREIEMHCMKEARVRKLIQGRGADVMDVRLTNSADPSFCGDLQYLTEEPKHGYVSKQYCVVKTRRAD